MSWIYVIRNGAFRTGDGELVAVAYSGFGGNLNAPAAMKVMGGPIPVGIWDIGAPFESEHTGPYALPLTPREGTETYGRSAFEIHGDLIGHVGEHLASHGCVILEREYRERVWDSGDHVLCVVAEDEDTPAVC